MAVSMSRTALRSASAKRASVSMKAFKTADPVAYAKSLPGITAPFPDMFDPAGFVKTASVKDVRRWRESELMHGRVSMLAAIGFIVGEQLEDFPAFVNFDGHITGPAAFQFSQVQQGFWEPLLIAIGLCESYRVGLGWETPKGTGFNALKDDYVMGDLGFDPLGLKPTDEAELFDLQTKELNNGRLAMIAIAAFVAQEVVDHQEIFEHLFRRIEEEAILEVDDIERDLGLPVTPVPEIVLEELGQVAK